MFEVSVADDGWMVAGFVCFIAFIIFVFSTGAVLGIFDDASAKGLIIGYGVCLVVFYGIAQVGVATVSADSRVDEYASSVDLASHFGLRSGEQYPLTLGNTQGSGVLGNASTAAGLFSSSASIDLRPTSTVSVGFQKEESWWQLTLPTDTVEYRKANSSSMIIWLNSQVIIDNNDGAASQEVYWKQTWGDCHWQLHNLWIRCEKDLISRELIVSPEAERAGFANVVNQYFDSARINLTDQQHAEIFPTN